MKYSGKKTSHRTGIRVTIPLLLLVLAIVTSVLIIYSTPVLTIEKRTSGNLTFIDGEGNQISGTIEISMIGAPPGRKDNVNSITWRNAPNAWIYFDARETKSVSMNLRISGDSPSGVVSLEDHGAALPGSVPRPAPGTPVKYVELHSSGVTFIDADISIYYTDAELGGLDEKSLVIYSYDGGAWNELTTKVDASENVVTATVNSLSVFAVSTQVPEGIVVRDTKNKPVISHIKTFDKAKNLKKETQTATLTTEDVSEDGELEVDALESKNVAVRLKLKGINRGEVVLDDFGKKNPESVPLPGRVVKYVEIGATGISYSSAVVRIYYTTAELGNVSEDTLVIYHWNSATSSWEALSTTVDTLNHIVTATTTSLSPFAVSAAATPGTQSLKVATNRFIILDDPSGWVSTQGDQWNGESTTIRWYVLVLNSSGLAVPAGINVTTYLKYPNGTVNYSSWSLTDSNGFVNFSRNLNNLNQIAVPWGVEGNWSINATATVDSQSISGNDTFIYDEYGCGKSGSGCHSSNWQSSATVSPKQVTAINGVGAGNIRDSPYLRGWDGLHNESNNQYPHGTSGGNIATGECLTCHKSYNGTYINSSRRDNYQPQYSGGLHYGKTNAACTNCHAGFVIGTYVNMPIKRCYDAGCHPKLNNNLTNQNYTQNSTLSYSYFPLNTTNAIRSHDLINTVPCISCHGDGHNITKPYNVSGTSNNITEYQQCTTCHGAYQRHNDSVSCIVCHSQDAHEIKVFAQNATYINGSNSSYRGNCTNCHQNSSFLNALLLQPKAGNYSGRNPPQVAVPLEHSNDPAAGGKWKQTYWTNSDQVTWCKYCHGETNHNAVALGRPSLWDGTNSVNSSLSPGNTTWCAGCHWQGYVSGSNTSSDMNSTFTGDSLLVPPETSGNTTNGANTSIYEYTNHSLYTSYSSILNDSACNRCHGYQYSFTTITQLMHNQSSVGGPDCVSCHDTGGIVLLSKINVTATNNTNAIHRNLNSGASAANSSAYYSNNKRCWACHGNGSEPSLYAHPSRYKTPYNCTDCHVQGAGQNFNYSPTNTLLNVTEHYWNGTDIKTPDATVCYICHNVSEMMISANDPDAGSGAVYGGANGGNNSTSHYGIKRADIRTGTSANCSYCHQNASTAFATAMIDPSYNRSISNHSLIYNSSNPTCTSSLCHNTGWIHNATLTKPVVNTTLCLSCHGSNGTGGTNYSGAVTGIKEKHNNSVNCTECHIDTSKDIHPVKYLRSDSTFSSSNSSAANCVTCHQTNDVDSKLTQTPPKITSHLYHSDNTSNGTIWNSTAYWTPTSPVTACTYCHNDTKHNATALGRPVDWKGNNMINSSIASGTWCASCHYQSYSSGSKNYSNMTQSFTTANLSVPPEITNGTYARNIYNRSGYYNHSLRNYSDEICRQCHGINISSSTTITAFMHNITGASCTDCHYSFSAMNNTTRPDRYVDQGMYNTSLHRSLSCQNCHTQGHRNIGARKACEDCHAVQANPFTDKDRHNITSTPSTYSVGGNNVVGITDCTTCHDAALYNRSISTYGYWKPKDCDYCHTYPDKYYE